MARAPSRRHLRSKLRSARVVRSAEAPRMEARAARRGPWALCHRTEPAAHRRASGGDRLARGAVECTESRWIIAAPSAAHFEDLRTVSSDGRRVAAATRQRWAGSRAPRPRGRGHGKPDWATATYSARRLDALPRYLQAVAGLSGQESDLPLGGHHQVGCCE